MDNNKSSSIGFPNPTYMWECEHCKQTFFTELIATLHEDTCKQRTNNVHAIERKLYIFIKDLHQEIVDMRPDDGFSSPRDIELVKQVNIKGAILDKLQEGMRVINPGFEIRS